MPEAIAHLGTNIPSQNPADQTSPPNRPLDNIYPLKHPQLSIAQLQHYFARAPGHSIGGASIPSVKLRAPPKQRHKNHPFIRRSRANNSKYPSDIYSKSKHLHQLDKMQNQFGTDVESKQTDNHLSSSDSVT